MLEWNQISRADLQVALLGPLWPPVDWKRFAEEEEEEERARRARLNDCLARASHLGAGAFRRAATLIACLLHYRALLFARPLAWPVFGPANLEQRARAKKSAKKK